MNIQSLKKALWSTIAGVILLQIGTVYMVFLRSQDDPSQKIPSLAEAPAKKQLELPPLYYFSDIWQSNYNDPPPKVTPVKKGPAPNWLQDQLKRTIQSCVVLKNGEFALVQIRGKDVLLEPYSKRKEEILEASLQDNPDKPWEVPISGGKAVVKEIKVNKGILFTYNGREAWYAETQSDNKDLRKVKIEENVKVLTNRETKLLARNYDSYMQPLGLKLHQDGSGKVIGVRVRRMKESYEAYKYGLRENDIVTDVNGEPLDSFSKQKMEYLAKKLRGNKIINVSILRDGKLITLSFRGPQGDE